MLVSLQAASEQRKRGRTDRRRDQTHRSHKTPIPGALPTVTTRLRARRQKPVELLADAQLVRQRRPRIVVRREIQIRRDGRQQVRAVALAPGIRVLGARAVRVEAVELGLVVEEHSKFRGGDAVDVRRASQERGPHRAAEPRPVRPAQVPHRLERRVLRDGQQV